MSRIAVCTIIAKNYMALARTLGASLHAHHPTVDFHILVIDPAEDPFNFEQPKATIWGPTQVMPAETFWPLTALYDITELSTAIKPFLLENLLDQGYDKVFYFDPDIQIIQPLQALFEELDDTTMVLTPHLLAPIPFDGKEPTEISILQAGAYNLGFIGISNREVTRSFLRWWQERLKEYCIVAPEQGLFVDQKWIDLAPGMFSGVKILHDPGYNVAYWNLNARQLSERDGKLLSNGDTLYFFHFSGFNPAYPNQLSKHQTRTKVSENSVLAKLLAGYAGMLELHEHSLFQRMPYTYNFFSNGVVFDVVCRDLIKRNPYLAEKFKRPLEAEATPSFFQWLNQNPRHEQGPAGLTNYMLGMYRRRPDLQTAFPDVQGRDREAFLRWFSLNAADSGVPNAFLPNQATPQLTERTSNEGVNLAGYLTAELGIGEAGRGYVAAVKTLGLDVALNNFTQTMNRLEDVSLSGFSEDNPHPINLLCINADQVPNFVQHVGPEYLRSKYNIGLWAWELPEFPIEWSDRFALFDEIWVGSGYMAEAVSKRSPIPVINVPYVVDVPEIPAPDKAHFGLGEHEFVFLFTFDYMSIFERKNPLAVVEAFKRAFPPEAPVRLVLKSINGDQDPDNQARLRQAAADHRITLLEGYLTKYDKNRLLASCDCYISLHRSEGFGLGMAEAMRMEKPVIATAWSGNMEFMTVNNSFLVQYEPTALQYDLGPYKQGQIWAEPDVDHAAALMRQIYEQPTLAKAKARRGACDIQERHSPEVIGRIIQERFTLARQACPHHPTIQALDMTHSKPTIQQGIRFIRHAMQVRPELILRQEWVKQSSHGWKGILAKKAVQALAKAYFGGKLR